MSGSGPSSTRAWGILPHALFNWVLAKYRIRNYQTAWTKALEHLDQLSPKQQKFFNLLTQNEKDLLRNGSSPDDILHLMKQAGLSKHSRFTRLSDRFASPLYQLQGVFEVTASTCSGIGAPIWAPIKLVLQVTCPLSLTSQPEAKYTVDGEIGRGWVWKNRYGSLRHARTAGVV